MWKRKSVQVIFCVTVSFCLTLTAVGWNILFFYVNLLLYLVINNGGTSADGSSFCSRSSFQTSVLTLLQLVQVFIRPRLTLRFLSSALDAARRWSSSWTDCLCVLCCWFNMRELLPKIWGCLLVIRWNNLIHVVELFYRSNLWIIDLNLSATSTTV